jgi:intermediate peptidase
MLRPRKIGKFIQSGWHTKPIHYYSTIPSLRALFDVTHAESDSIHSTDLNGSRGLFAIPMFSSPEGIKQSGGQAIKHARSLVNKIVTANTIDEKRRTIKRLDLLSDTLCSVLDAVEVVRHVHPDDRFVNAALDTHNELSTYLNQLNTHRGLYKVSVRHVQRVKTKLGRRSQNF